MQRIDTITDLKRVLREHRRSGARIGLVPTMGALHEGHLSLVDALRARCDVIVATIFVNPKQFGPSEDLDRYPRTLERDASLLADRGVQLLFAPEVRTIYPDGFRTNVSIAGVSEGLCGAQRPGHFDGVATIVLKLFNIVGPDVAVFGEKDFQQLAVIRAMTRDLDLHFDLEIVGAPIVREPDGLAMSSRNVFLSPEERVRARSLSAGLLAAEEAFRAGERRGPRLCGLARDVMAASDVHPQYLELRGFDDLAPLDLADGPSVLLTAAYVGSTRLIDNLILSRS
ncbi:MAG: pantoate--beta-alanine ligase [Deltaproteobacteria bacterium]|nr:pantoate--beta-alanine ligase [Deltaproteobacteria bacterium]